VRNDHHIHVEASTMKKFAETLSVCMAVLTVNLAGLSAQAGAAPSLATPLQAEGDFDGDGAPDRAVLEAKSGGAELVFELGTGKTRRKTLSRLNIDTASITVAARGREFSDACLRGVGKDCASSAETRIVLKADGVLVEQAEASSILFYLKGGAVKSLTVSD
jgi:hypothetical protein